MPTGFRSVRRPRDTATLVVAVSVYLLVLIAEPFLHHSAACHARTPSHCTACALQMTSQSVEDSSPIQAIVLLPDAGKLLPDSVSRDLTPLVTRTKDRSPPA